MAVLVVDRLEAVEIDLQERQPAGVIPGKRELAAELPAELPAVDKSGRAVGRGQPEHLRLRVASIGNILHRAGRPDQLTIGANSWVMRPCTHWTVPSSRDDPVFQIRGFPRAE